MVCLQKTTPSAAKKVLNWLASTGQLSILPKCHSMKYKKRSLQAISRCSRHWLALVWQGTLVKRLSYLFNLSKLSRDDHTGFPVDLCPTVPNLKSEWNLSPQEGQTITSPPMFSGIRNCWSQPVQLTIFLRGILGQRVNKL